MTKTATDNALSPQAQRVAGRYDIVQELGRGGMARVYEVCDARNGQRLALKQLEHSATDNATLTALFEREFQTLAQLQHPHVIAVYDYGVLAAGSPYYTMELLDGGDLRERAPLPWQTACRLAFEVCSSLALLHSRRLLHRDISPRNIRCTQDDRAKLIDFGAMAPMSAGGDDVVGTPAFVAPETVHRLALDARTDLFSLGATLYYTLTGRLPYLARSFPEAIMAWRDKVAAPSKHVADIPRALDDLVLALISVEPDVRPKSAYDVMQRLAAIAELSGDEAEAVPRAYLATPTLVGREALLATCREQLVAARLRRGGALHLSGGAGMGRSRLLDACALEAKALGFTVMRATAGGSRAALSTAATLTQHLIDALPDAELAQIPPELLADSPTELPAEDAPPPRPSLRDLDSSGLDPQHLQQQIGRFWAIASRTRPLLLAIDDVHRIDADSASVLLRVLDLAPSSAILAVISTDSDEPASDASTALSRRCRALPVEPLTPEQTHQLLGSLFGDTAYLEALTREISTVARGNPRQTLDVAQHLVDRGLIRYETGVWVLPQHIGAEDLPDSALGAIAARVESLSQHARTLAQAQALAFWENMLDQDYRALLPELASHALEQAVAELLCAGALTRLGASYVLSNRLWSRALEARLTPEESRELQRRLASLYKDNSPTAHIYHAFAGGLDEAGLDALTQYNAWIATLTTYESTVEQNVNKMMSVYPRAFEAAHRLDKSPRYQSELRRWHIAGTMALDVEDSRESWQLWLAQLERDSGLDLYRADPDTSDPTQRLMRSLQAAQERYLATPEPERVYNVEEALRGLAEYVVMQIRTAGRAHDASTLRTLPGILEPYTALSPLLEAIWRNARATYAATLGELHHARSDWLQVLEQLRGVTGAELAHVHHITNAVAFAVGMTEAQLGIKTASTWADRLDADPFQRVSALQLRRIVRLEQGDLKGAESFRRQAEVVSLQLRTPQMFQLLLNEELIASAYAGDLAGVKECIEHMRPLAAHCRGWTASLLFAEAHFELTRGDLCATHDKLRECIRDAETLDDQGYMINTQMWVAAHALLAETLLELERPEEARAAALRALDMLAKNQLSIQTLELVRARARADAKLGEPGAAAPLEATIAEQEQLGVSGLHLGRSYEARARIAAQQGDIQAFEHYAALTAREYRYGTQYGLGARYERLINEARRLGLPFDSPQDVVTTGLGETQARTDVGKLISQRMGTTQQPQQRAQTALQLICEARGAHSGHLYLPSASGTLVLQASQGDAAPPARVDELQLFVERARQRDADLDEMDTDRLADDLPLQTVVEVDGRRLALVIISCLVDGEMRLAGLAAVSANDNANDNASGNVAHEAELLHNLAKHLLPA